MKKLKLEIIMALKKGVIEMKKKIFIIAGIIAITFLMILGFETKTMQKNSIEETQKEMEVIAEDVKDITKIEVEQKQQENTEKTTTETTTKTESVISQKETQKSEVSNAQQQEQNSNKTTSVKENVVKQEPKKEQEDVPKKVEEKVEVKEEIIEDKPQEETSEENVVEEEKLVDEEYERLMKEVEYATYDECMKAGFEIAFSDTVNILGFDPIEIIYKGKVIGYKLKINYTNPMEN